MKLRAAFWSAVGWRHDPACIHLMMITCYLSLSFLVKIHYQGWRHILNRGLARLKHWPQRTRALFLTYMKYWKLWLDHQKYSIIFFFKKNLKREPHPPKLLLSLATSLWSLPASSQLLFDSKRDSSLIKSFALWVKVGIIFAGDSNMVSSITSKAYQRKKSSLSPL